MTVHLCVRGTGIEMTGPHASHEGLERYHLGVIKDEGELALLEEHILACAECAEPTAVTAEYIDAMRAAARVQR